MFALTETALSGCFEIRPPVFDDARGRFVKLFHREMFAERGLATDFPEQYCSLSHRGVVRGLHFQTPPHDHAKLVYCLVGEVFDVVLDLRVGSPTWGRTASLTLSAERANGLYVPKGLAHGFCATSDTALLVYDVETVHAPENDAGVLWSSVGVDWPVAAPIVSPRDAAFPPFAAFESPFRHG